MASGISNGLDGHTSQEVCPYNAKFSRASNEEAFTPRAELVNPDFSAFATMDDVEFKARFGDTPLARAKRAGLRRNAAAVASNEGPASRVRSVPSGTVTDG